MATASSFMKGFSEAYLADLGRIIAAWSHIEQQFDMLFLSLVVFRDKSSGSTKTPEFQKLMGGRFSDRLTMLRNRSAQMDLSEETMRETDAVLSQLDTLRNERDRIAHSVWSPTLDDPEAAQAVFKSWKNQKEHEWKLVEQDRLREIFGRMEDLFWRLFKLSFPLRDAKFAAPAASTKR